MARDYWLHPDQYIALLRGYEIQMPEEKLGLKDVIRKIKEQGDKFTIFDNGMYIKLGLGPDDNLVETDVYR